MDLGDRLICKHDRILSALKTQIVRRGQPFLSVVMQVAGLRAFIGVVLARRRKSARGFVDSRLAPVPT